MKVASFITGNTKLDAFLNEKTAQIILIVRNEEKSTKIYFQNGRELAYFIRFASKLLASVMTKAKKSREEILQAVCHHAEAGASDVLPDEPLQTTLEAI